MVYKAIIFDLDGTAIPNGYDAVPSKRIIESIQKALVTFKLCAATGRPITNAKKILDTLGLTDPCVISAGTEIVNPKTGKVLWTCDIEPNDIQLVLKACKPFPYEILVRNELEGEGAVADGRVVTEPVNVMYIMHCQVEDAAKIMAELVKIPTIAASDVTSWTGQGLDIHVTNIMATKEHAIAKLLEILGVSKNETIGVGDNNNDVHLFKAVGLKVAMGNATNLLKSQADVICGTVSNDGLAKFIDEQVAEANNLT